MFFTAKSPAELNRQGRQERLVFLLFKELAKAVFQELFPTFTECLFAMLEIIHNTTEISIIPLFTEQLCLVLIQFLGNADECELITIGHFL